MHNGVVLAIMINYKAIHATNKAILTFTLKINFPQCTTARNYEN